MNTTTTIRQKYFQALNGLKYDSIEIPIFADVVNPNVQLPEIKGAETYILLQDQQTNDANQVYCDYDVASLITVKVVTKFGLGGSKINCEDIARMIDEVIRNGRDSNNIGVKDVKLVNSFTTTEVTQSSIAFQYVLTYQNTVTY